MKNLKALFLVAALVLSAGMTAQEIKPKFEEKGELIKGTFYDEDGNISQEGTYKDGKLHGEWVSYDKEGKKTAVATYRQGQKTGTWYFWTGDLLTEVNYDNNRIAEVNRYKSLEKLVADN